MRFFTRFLEFLRKKRILIFLIIAAVSIFAAFHYDSQFRAWVISFQGRDWKHGREYAIAVKLSRYGDWPQLIGGGILAALIARWLRSPTWSKIFVMAVVSAIIAGVLATSCRSLTGRARPDIPSSIAPGWYGPYHDGRCLIGVPAYNSFPSGHTATAVGMAAAILFTRPLWGIPCMLVALSIATSRLYLGKHHLSDVTVSLFLGLASAWLLTGLFFRRIGRTERI